MLLTKLVKEQISETATSENGSFTRGLLERVQCKAPSDS